MKKNVFGRNFKRDANERKALFKNLLTSLVMEERIQTTEAKAKAIKAAADKLVTRAKKGGPSAQRFLEPSVNHDAVVKLMTDIGPRFATRHGGYTRIIRTKNRIADNAPQVFMEWTEIPEKVKVAPKVKKGVVSKGAEVKPKAQTKSKTGEPLESTVAVSAPGAPKAKKEQVQKPGIFKRLVTRQKKGSS
jgi:large subunit ribosomal protein L17